MRRSLLTLLLACLVVVLPGLPPARAGSASTYDDPRGEVPHPAGDIVRSEVYRNNSSPPPNLFFQVTMAAFPPDEYLGDLSLTWSVDATEDLRPDFDAVFGPDPRFECDYSFRVVRRSDGAVVCDLDELFAFGLPGRPDTPGYYASVPLECLGGNGPVYRVSVRLALDPRPEDRMPSSVDLVGLTGKLEQPGQTSRSVGEGIWAVTAGGAVRLGGDATRIGDTSGIPLNQPIVGMAATASRTGYWLVASDGGIFSFGEAAFHGSTGAIRLNQPIVGMASTPSGKGYRLVASDGGIFCFGDAQFFGSTGAVRLNQPVVGMAATPTGKGYWLVARDGGIFAFGDARFHGSTGAIRLNQPIVGMAPNPYTGGYWLVAADGGIFAFNTPFYGSGVGQIEPGKAVAVVPTVNATGYAIVSSSGIGYPYGQAIVAHTELGRGATFVGVARSS